MTIQVKVLWEANKKWVFLWVFSINFYGFNTSRHLLIQQRQKGKN